MVLALGCIVAVWLVVGWVLVLAMQWPAHSPLPPCVPVCCVREILRKGQQGGELVFRISATALLLLLQSESDAASEIDCGSGKLGGSSWKLELQPRPALCSLFPRYS